MKKTLLYHIFAVGLMLIASGGAFAQSTSEGVHKYTFSGTDITQVGTDQVVYLLNLGKYQNAKSKNDPYFVGRGQQWGTEIVISNIPLPLKIEKVANSETYRLRTTVNENGTSTAGCIGFLMDTNDAHAYFDDRGTGDNLNTTFKRVTEGRKGVSTANFVYTMSHYQEAKGDHEAGTYFAAALYHPHGTDNANRTDHVNGFTEEQLETAKQTKDSTNFVDNNDDLWMIITEQQLKNYFSQVDAAQNDPAIATFLIKDPDFARADTDIKNWFDEDGNSLQKDFTRNANDVNARFGPRSKWYFSSNNNGGRYNSPHNYYVGNGWHTDANNDATTAGQRANGGKWTANILGRGKVSQQVSLDGLRGGWYAVRVSATTFRNKAAGKDQYVKLFASTSNQTVNNFVAADPADPPTFTLADTIVNDGKHEASVLIYIKGDGTSDNKITNTTLTIGIDATDPQIKNDDDVAARTWTCFDNFQLWYLGDPKNIVLLDEDNKELDNINKQNTFVNTNNLSNGNTGSRTKSTVYLKRSMTAGVWSTLVLPFSIEEDVVLQTFGAGTVYAELKGANNPDAPTTIFFERRTDGIKAGKLYVIRPTNNIPTGQQKVESSTLQSDGKTPLITWGTDNTNDQSYWTFESVDFGQTENYADKVTDNSEKETYHDGTVYFTGTYLNHFDDATPYIPEKSYVLSGNTVTEKQTENGIKAGYWYYRTEKTKVKAFRGWLQTTDPTSTSTTAKTSIFVDGEEWPVNYDSVTGIEDINLDGKKIVIVDKGVYNLQGQRIRKDSSIEGLANGIYIVNGKKVLVK